MAANPATIARLVTNSQGMGSPSDVEIVGCYAHHNDRLALLSRRQWGDKLASVMVEKCRQPAMFHGDNLGFLRGINSEAVHLIATD